MYRRLLIVLLLLSIVGAARAETDAFQSDGEMLVYVDVVGAPGDGEKTLAAALSERLLSLGLVLSGTPAANVYEIQGAVHLSPAKGGKQNVRIDWTVFGPEGTRLGTVTQTKLFRKGSLDRKWGAAAAAAADAAAQDILKLLPH
jgi:hypothetical protein